MLLVWGTHFENHNLMASCLNEKDDSFRKKADSLVLIRVNFK